MSVLRCRRPIWYCHVQRETSCIKSTVNFPILGTRKQGRPGNTWSECVMTDVSNFGLASIDPQDRDARRAGFRLILVSSLRHCQPHRMGHGQHLKLKMDMDGWMVCSFIALYGSQRQLVKWPAGRASMFGDIIEVTACIWIPCTNLLCHPGMANSEDGQGFITWYVNVKRHLSLALVVLSGRSTTEGQTLLAEIT